MIIAINMGKRIIDGLKPQEHREVDENQAKVYEKLLPREIKIIRKNDVGVQVDAAPAEKVVAETPVTYSLPTEQPTVEVESSVEVEPEITLEDVGVTYTTEPIQQQDDNDDDGMF